VSATRPLLSILCAAACGGGGTDPDARRGDPSLLVGAFELEVVAPIAANGTTPARDGYTSVLGTIYDAPQPSPLAWAVTMTDGACTLYVPDPPFCATPCGTDAVCVAADTCQAYATKQSVGAVTARGLATTAGADELVMTPVVNNYQVPAGTTLAYPAFAEGDALELAAEGSAFTDPFTLSAMGIGELALANADGLALVRGEALALGWTAGTVSGAAVTVKLDISHHGGSKGKIECRAPDTGALVLGAGLVAALLDLGAAGFPTIIVARTITASAVISAGRVDLNVSAEVERPIAVPGVESCTEDTECTPPESCQDDLTCG
jgi:hypothetical protein